jgi:hypothetical protein
MVERNMIPWHEEALRLRAQRLSYEAISARLGYHAKTIARTVLRYMPGGTKKASLHPEWPPEKDERLRQLIDEKLTAGAIAARMGITRNAVLGRAMRLGLRLKSKRAEMAALPKTDRPKPVKPRNKINFRPATVEEDMGAQQRYESYEKRFLEGYRGQKGRLTITELRPYVCRFPIEGKYCGLPSHRESSWCREHFHRVSAVYQQAGGAAK